MNEVIDVVLKKVRNNFWGNFFDIILNSVEQEVMSNIRDNTLVKIDSAIDDIYDSTTQ